MKKILTGICIFTLAISVFGAEGAFAQSSTSTQAISAAPKSVTIERNGKVKLEGVISSITGPTSIAVSSYGGTWTVTTLNAKLVRHFDDLSNISEFQVGDKVTINGTAAQNSQIITATKVKNESITARDADF